MKNLEGQVHGLKVSRGMAQASKQRMEELLGKIRSVLQ